MLNPTATTSSGRYELAAPHCVADDFGGEIVAINLNDGRYFSLRGLAHAVWQDLIAGFSPRSIVDGLAAVDLAVADAAAVLIADLERHALIRPSALDAASGNPAMSIPLAQDGAAPPVIEVFDDMADLFESDPIHDADEQIGWPVRREGAR